MFVLAASLPQDLLYPHRHQFEAYRGLLNAHRGHELFQLFLEPVDRNLPGPQAAQLRARSNSISEAVVSALNDLEWLTKIVTGYGKQHCFEIRDFLRLRGGCHAPGYGTHADSESLSSFRSPELASRLAHVRSPTE
jgi:hypothetical protein